MYNFAMPNLIGKTLGKVRVEMFLAKGGMAEVYVGAHTSLHRSVAVKLLKADLQGEPDLRERFEREARVIAMLRHPNIVQVFDFDEYENQPYLVMEYVPGLSLGSYLRALHKRSERIALPTVLSILKKVASALSYAHENNVVHRDVKPANILLTSRSTPISENITLPDDVEPILTDFGLVRFTQSATQTSTGVITGTPAYMSPEQARGEHVGITSDVYSLGATVYEMLAGNVPFQADSTLGVLHQVVNEQHPPIDGISEMLQDVIDRAMEKDPNDRFQSALEFASAFEEAVSASSNKETALFPSSAISRSATLSRRQYENIAANDIPKKKNYAPLVIGIAGLLLTAAALFFARMGQTPVETPVAISNTPPATDTATVDPANVPVEPTTKTEIPSVVGLLRFQDGSAHADQVTFSSSTLPLPSEGNQYEAWLVEDDAETRFSIGVVKFDAGNNASLSYVDKQGRNLLNSYHGLELTIEPVGDTNPNPSNEIAYLTMLPSGGFGHVRHLIATYNDNPNQTAFIYGLQNDSELLNSLSAAMLEAFDAGDEKAVKFNAEQMLNIIVGNQSENHKDWNGDGNIDDPSDGFGMLLNGSNGGYIQGTYSHADLSAAAPDATENMQVHGEHVTIAATNISNWAPLLRDELIATLNATSLVDAEGSIRQAVVLVDQIYNGVDINGNENIEPIPGEGGVLTAYGHSYYMADIVLMP